MQTKSLYDISNIELLETDKTITNFSSINYDEHWIYLYAYPETEYIENGRLSFPLPLLYRFSKDGKSSEKINLPLDKPLNQNEISHWALEFSLLGGYPTQFDIFNNILYYISPTTGEYMCYSIDGSVESQKVFS